MTAIGNWILGTLAGGLGLLALLAAARAQDDYVYAVGLIVAVACALFVMGAIKQTFDRANRE